MKILAMEESDPELRKHIFKILDDDTAIIAIVSPYKPFDIIPIITPEIRSQEKLDVEYVVSEIKGRGINKLFVLVDSFLGATISLIGIIRELMGNFNYIIVFVPHMASNSGNLMISIGEKTVMGEAEEVVNRLKNPDPSYVTPFEAVSDILGDSIIKSIEDQELWKIMKSWIRKYIKKEDKYIVRFLLPDPRILKGSD
ncbi:MAG: hypothetical protein SVM80_03650 [Halobacteriota archaeon]|nr:hypothetical protein [Halobacteriota archaeon]